MESRHSMRRSSGTAVFLVTVVVTLTTIVFTAARDNTNSRLKGVIDGGKTDDVGYYYFDVLKK